MSTLEFSNWKPERTFEVTADRDPFKPYDHQVAAWDSMSRYFLEQKRKAGILVVPTGGGKTAIAARWLLKEHISKGGRVLWFAHRRSLLRQAFNTFARAAHLAAPKKDLSLITVSSDDRRWSAVAAKHDVVFSSVQSAVLEQNFGFLDQMHNQSPNGLFVVVDEAHHGAAPSYLKVLGAMKQAGCPVLGLTATPVRVDERDEVRLWHLFEGMIYEVKKTTLFNQGILAQPVLETIETKINFENEFTFEDYEYLKRFGDLGPRVLERLSKHAGRNALIVEHYVENAEKYGKTIVFGGDTLHARSLAEEFRRKGVDADYVDYGRSDANTVMAAYRDTAKPMVLANVEMLTEGFDAPRTRTVFIARPTRSEALLSQMVGRALRGQRAGGNATAYLVTFLDTWEHFDVLDAEYVVRGGTPEPPSTAAPVRGPLVTISSELVREAYKLLQSNVRGEFLGLHQCLPHSWFIWEEEFEDDTQTRLVLVFENQRDGFRAFMEAFADPSKIPAEVTEDFARDQVRRFFSDCPDPLPRWSDLKSLLDARRKGCEIHSYTFEEKKAFDPAVLAKKIYDDGLAPRAQEEELKRIWTANTACQMVYRQDFRAFLEDVSRELLMLSSAPVVTPDPKIVEVVPHQSPRPWGPGEKPHSLTRITDVVSSQRKHFPDGPPTIKDITYSARPLGSLWGYYRFSDRSVTINQSLNSPDIPLFVLEFLVYHELLHADMPSAGHNRDFRERERRFVPSPEAVEDATTRGLMPGKAKDAWRVMADQFLDTFQHYYAYRTPGTTMGM